MNAFNDGFMTAWDGAVDVLNRVFAEGMDVNCIMPESAWAIYPPAPLPAQGGTALRAGGGDLANITDKVIQRYISREIQPLVQNVQERIGANPTADGLPLASLHNRLGILLVRAGRIAEAKAAYEQAADMGSVPAMTNRGNLALIEKDYTTAERWFTLALARDRENAAALQGLEKVSAYGDIR